MMNAIELYGENRVALSTLTGSSGTLSLGSLIDQKPSTKWQSVGSSDAIDEWLVAQFLDKSGLPTLRQFDRLILLNTNIKSGYAAYYNGSAWANINDTVTGDLAKPNKIFSFSPVSGYSLKFWFETTQTPNQQKYLGELKACKHILTLNALTNFERSGESKRGDYRVANGDLVKWSEWEKFGGTLRIQNLSQAQRDAIRQAVVDYDFLTFVFNDDPDNMEVYEVSVSTPMAERLNRRIGLYELELALKER